MATSYTQLRLDPLPHDHAEELLGALLGPDAGLDPLTRVLIARTEGNPFFLEESVRALVETGSLIGERGARYTRAVKEGPDMVGARTREVRLSSKHQIVIPRESREVLGLKPGDRLLVVTLGEQVILLRKPIRHAEATASLGRGLYPKRYLESERRAWR